MKVLVIGGGGQLGSKIIERAEKAGGVFDVYATYMVRKPQIHQSKIFQLDKTDRRAVESLFQRLKPDMVIDTAALHSVDYCENNKKEAWAVNVEGTRNVAEACKKFGAKMVFVSTDYVFDGEMGNYVEEDPKNPINYYGLSKLEAEKVVAQNCKDHIIARPSVIYGWIPLKQRQLQSSSGKPLNFAMWLIQKLKDGEPVRIVTDQYSSPTLSDNLAEILLKLGGSQFNGVYHTAGKTRLGRYDFAVEIAKKLNLDRSLISSITTSQLKQVAKRPVDSSLNVGKVEKQLNVSMLRIEEALQLVLEQAGVDA